MQTPEQIAAGLSEAQKRILIELFDGTPKWDVDANEQDMSALARFHLTSLHLTPLGLSVREILITKEARRG